MELIWLTDSVDLGGGKEFVEALSRAVGTRTITVVEGGLAPARSLVAAENNAGSLTVKVLRSAAGSASAGVVRALDLKGLPLGDASFSFGSSDTETDTELTLPVEIRNDIARLEIIGEASAGAIQLLDKRWRRRSIGVVTGATLDNSQPLLASTYYLTRALAPFADVRLADRGSPAQAVTQFLDQRLPMMILADVGNVAESKERSRAGSKRAACWCVLPDRGLLPAKMTWSRSGCAAADAFSAALCPGINPNRWPRSRARARFSACRCQSM